MPSAIQRLNEIKAAERSRMDKLAGSMSEGVTMIDENLEVVLVNSVAQKILGVENPDLEAIQNTLGLDLMRSKAQSEKKAVDLVIKEAKIYSGGYEATASIIRKTAGTFIGFLIFIRELTKQIQD